MDIRLKIIRVLKRLSPSDFEGIGARNLEEVHERSYRLRGNDRSYFVKWIPGDDEYGINEVRVNREVLTKASIPSPRLLFESKAEEATLACWEWIDGVDLRHQRRHLLPDAFARLGEFHAAQRHSKSVCSPTTHQAFSSIREMLSAEVDFLCSFYDSSVKPRCGTIFSLLEVGYATFIHGDMHPGNIRSTKDGLQFVDWGYGMSSLNLFDLDYVQSIPLSAQEMPWWVIAPSESDSVLTAYFDACGLGGLDYRQIHRAVMLWSELGAYRNSIENSNQGGAAVCRQNIELLMQTSDSKPLPGRPPSDPQ